MKHKEISQVSISNQLNDDPHVQDYDENFAILTQELSLPAAKQACISLGLSPVDLRTPAMRWQENQQNSWSIQMLSKLSLASILTDKHYSQSMNLTQQLP